METRVVLHTNGEKTLCPACVQNDRNTVGSLWLSVWNYQVNEHKLYLDGAWCEACKTLLVWPDSKGAIEPDIENSPKNPHKR